MKLSDYIIRYLEEYGIKDAFLLSGGGMMHLLNSIANSHKISKYYNLNEQATSICADAYAQYTNKLSFCMVTTGPGATNAITGVVSAYQDSTPMLIISGQVKTADFAPFGVRSYGPQEVDIVNIIKNNTKYAVTITDKDKIKYHLQKAIHLATSGRKGPVWIDIPLDIQAAEIDEDRLSEYYPEDEDSVIDLPLVERLVRDLEQAKRPVMLFGQGVIASGASDLARKLINTYEVPALCTWRAKELFYESNEYFFGFPGALAPRYSNFILQKSDFLLVIGSRVNFSLTAYNEANFAPNAKKYIVDIDENEIRKLSISFEGIFNCDAKEFLTKILSSMDSISLHTTHWVKYCKQLKQKYPICDEKTDIKSKYVYGYDFTKKLSEYSKANDVFVASPTGRVCAAMNLGLSLRNGQRFISPMGLGSMGYALPSAISVSIASKKRTIVFEGDGSLQHNIQELQLISYYKLPIKLFIYNNFGYSSIYGMQNSHFKGKLAGCNKDSGMSLPDLEKIAQAYGLKYSLIKDTSELNEGIKNALADDIPELIEVIGDIRYEEVPRAQTKINKDGTIQSSKLENLYPFIECEY